MYQSLRAFVRPDPEGPRAYGPKRHVARLFRVHLTSDIYERLCDWGLRPLLDWERRRRIAAIETARVLFIHVPKNAGMSISRALYGRQIKHSTVRYYQRVAPALLSDVTSFAVVRDPVERFLSAYHYGRQGGTRDNQVSLPFRALYRSFRCVDDALDHLESADFPYGVDHIFRPQSWYVLDETGFPAVDRLFRLGSIELDRFLADAQVPKLPHVNAGARPAEALNSAQIARLRNLYRRDFELFETIGGQG